MWWFCIAPSYDDKIDWWQYYRQLETLDEDFIEERLHKKNLIHNSRMVVTLSLSKGNPNPKLETLKLIWVQ